VDSCTVFRYVLIRSPVHCVCLQVYTVSKDGALVVWGCSVTLTEMQDYIRKTTRDAMKEEQEREEKEEKKEEEEEEEEEEERVEGMAAKGSDSDVECESEESEESDEEAVAMETVDKVTRPQRGRTDSSSSEGEQDGMDCQLACCESHVAVTPGFSLPPPRPSSTLKQEKKTSQHLPLDKDGQVSQLQIPEVAHQLVLMQTLCPFRRRVAFPVQI